MTILVELLREKFNFHPCAQTSGLQSELSQLVGAARLCVRRLSLPASLLSSCLLLLSKRDQVKVLLGTESSECEEENYLCSSSLASCKDELWLQLACSRSSSCYSTEHRTNGARRPASQQASQPTNQTARITTN